MVKRYKLIRVYEEDIPKLREKGQRMERTIETFTGKKKTIPLIKVIHYVASNPTEIHENKLIKEINVKRVRRVKQCVA